MITKPFNTNTNQNSITWGAIFAGVIIALAITFLLNLLGVGLGFTVFTLKTETLSNLGIGSAVWFSLVGILSALPSGWVAGRFAHSDLLEEGILNGLLTWSFSTFFMILLTVSTIGAAIGGAVTTVGKTISSTSQATLSVGIKAVKNIPHLDLTVDKVKNQVEKMIAQAQETGLQNLSDQNKEQLRDSIIEWATAEPGNYSSLIRLKVVDFLVKTAGMSQEKADQTVKKLEEEYNSFKDTMEKKAEEAKEKAREVIEPAIHLSGTIMIMIFFILLLSAGAGALGGMLGVATRRE